MLPLQQLLLLLLRWQGQFHAVLRQLGLLWSVDTLHACLHLTLLQWASLLLLQRLLLQRLLLLRRHFLDRLTYFQVRLLHGLRP
jgi:hypothetical protein